MNHCDMCGEEVADYIEGDGVQIAFDDDSRAADFGVPPHAKEQYGAFKGCFVWPTRLGIGCSCKRQRRKEKLK